MQKNLSEYAGEDRIISSVEMMIAASESPSSRIRVRSNLPSLDAAVDGFQGGELYVISGPTKHGKSLLAQSLTVSFAKQQFQPLWFTYELPARQFLSRFPEAPLIYLPAKLKSGAMEWLTERCGEGFAKFHTRIVFIDHLHYLFDIARTHNPSLEIGSIIRRLKTLAISEDFLIFLLCHTKMGSREENLSYESIRDSSFVSQESDCVLMIQRTPDEGQNTGRVSVEFHRRTGVIQKMVKIIKVGGLFQEQAPQEEERKDLQ